MTNQSFQQQVDELKQQWATDPRWSGVQRDYTAEDVVRLRGSFTPECTIARRGAAVAASDVRIPSFPGI